MKNSLLIVTCIWIFIPQVLFSQNWKWAKSGYAAEGNNCITDHFGNIITIGYVWYPTIIAGDTVNNSGSEFELVISKYSNSGNAIWAISPEYGYSNPFAMDVDTIGNIYVLASYYDTLTFGADTFINNDTSLNVIKYFISKISSSGNLIWAKELGNVASNDSLQDNGDFGDIAVDASGNILVTCSFNNNPTIGSFSFANHDTTLMTQDIFFAKLDTTGNVIWAATYGGPGNESPMDLAVSQQSNVYLSGNFSSDSFSVGSGIIHNGDTSRGNSSFFLVKMDSAENTIWVSAPVGRFINEALYGIAVDGNDCPYITGTFTDMQLNLGPFSLPSANPSSQNGFLAKYKSSGAVLWLKGFYGYQILPWAISINSCNNSVWIAGGISPVFTYTLDGNPLISPAPSGLYDPVFIAGWREDSTFINATSLESGGDDWLGLTNDDSGNVYFCADIWIDTLIVGSDTLPCPLLDSIGEYFLLAKYFSGDTCAYAPTGIADLKQQVNEHINIYPDPVKNVLVGNADINMNKIEIMDITGRSLYLSLNTGSSFRIDVEWLQPGIYFVRVNNDFVQKFLKE